MNHTLLHEIIGISQKEIQTKTDISNVVELNGHSNNILRVHLSDGRIIIIKQSEYDWAHRRFDSARNASSLLQNKTDIVSPKHISIPGELVQKPTLAYWYLPFPTLKEIWPNLSEKKKRSAVQSFGELLKKLHSVKLWGYGLIREKSSNNSLSSFVENDLKERLKPTLYSHWTEGVSIVDHLLEMLPYLSDKNKQAELVHNDLHFGNVLCKVESGHVKCIGFLDLEEARGGSWESDLASAMVFHHPIFADRRKSIRWLDGFDELLKKGYGREPDAGRLRFFRICHLLNQGLFSVMDGEHIHAGWIREEINDLLNKMENNIDKAHPKSAGGMR